MANKKNYNKKANVEEVIKTEAVEEPKVEETKDTSEYEVILATPSYYIVKKDGINITINKLNNYNRGDIVTL